MASFVACGNNDQETLLLFNSTAGTPLFENVNLNGADLAALNLQSSASNCQVWVAQRALTNDVVFGCYFKTGAATGGGTRKIFSWEAGNTDKAFTLQHNNNGTLSILDNADATVATGTATPFSASTWHLIEFIFDQATSTTGTVTVYVDGSSVVSTSGQNFTTTGNANKLRWEGPQRVGAWYCLESGTGVSDFLGDFEVRTLQGDGNTNGGDAWDVGTWANVSETPYNGSVFFNVAEFTQNAALSNYREDQGGTRAGPNGVSGIGTIYGITYCAIADRGGGSGAGDQKDLLGGNSVDGTTNLLSMGLTTSPELYTIGSESASVVPTGSEYSRIGFAHNGARDMIIFEAWSSLLYATQAGQTISPTGFTVSQTFGSTTVVDDKVISATGFSVAQTFGSATVVADSVIQATGFTNAAAFGTAQIDRNIQAAGFTVTQTFVAPQVNVAIALPEIDVSVAFGSTTVIGNQTIEASGFTVAQTFQNPNVAIDRTIEPAGFAVAQTFGSATVTEQQLIEPAGFTVTQTFAAPQINRTIDGSPFTVSVTFGSAQIDQRVFASTFSVPATFGSATISTAQFVQPTGFTNAASFGTAQVNVNVNPTGFTNAASFATSTIAQTIAATGFTNTVTVPSPTIGGNRNIINPGITADVTFGSATVSQQAGWFPLPTTGSWTDIAGPTGSWTDIADPGGSWSDIEE